MNFDVVGLRTECRDNPFGVELQRPRLSWRLQTDRTGARQAAYRIRVATSLDALNAGGVDVWDSGRVASAQCFDVAYKGHPRRGYIGLQDHGSSCRFKNIKLLPIR